MNNIFLCYRRADTAGWAGRLHVDLASKFPHITVFKDIENIPVGADWDAYIANALASCKVLIALMGPDWLAPDGQGHRRVDDPEDVLRIEIATALKRNLLVIPALVGGATLPGQHELPADLKPLLRRHAHELTDLRWKDDCTRLVEALAKVIPPPPWYRRRATVITVAVLCSAVLSVALWREMDSRRAGPGGAPPTVSQARQPEGPASDPGQPQPASVPPVVGTDQGGAEDENRRKERLEAQRRTEEQQRRKDQAAQPARLAEEQRRKDQAAQAARLAEDEQRRKDQAAQAARLAEEEEQRRKDQAAQAARLAEEQRRKEREEAQRRAEEEKLRREQADLARAETESQAIQRTYESVKGTVNCAQARQAVTQIRDHGNSSLRVPGSLRNTVRYPNTVASPSISDLAIDRVARIKEQKQQCF